METEQVNLVHFYIGHRGQYSKHTSLHAFCIQVKGNDLDTKSLQRDMFAVLASAMAHALIVIYDNMIIQIWRDIFSFPTTVAAADFGLFQSADISSLLSEQN